MRSTSSVRPGGPGRTDERPGTVTRRSTSPRTCAALGSVSVLARATVDLPTAVTPVARTAPAAKDVRPAP
ncbi:hypothetical protein ACFVOR_11555 [Streptomyces sp. NPDC057837]|uniref:hypothetical protein n=1 Tax=Streptomyces sp. NPDC057837 TaxID=3346260 RepID=UPI0036C65AEE